MTLRFGSCFNRDRLRKAKLPDGLSPTRIRGGSGRANNGGVPVVRQEHHVSGETLQATTSNG